MAMAMVGAPVRNTVRDTRSTVYRVATHAFRIAGRITSIPKAIGIAHKGRAMWW